MKLSAIYSIRRLLSAVLFLIAGIFIAINIGVFKASSIGTIDSILTVCWGACWVITAIHNIYYRAIVAKRAITNDADSPIMNDRILGLRRSTHSQIKSILATTTAASSLIMDSYKAINTPTQTQLLRVAGSILWVQHGMFETWLAVRHERKQEDHPDRSIQPCGVKPSIYHVFNTCLYLSAGLTYSVALWTDKTFSPLTIAPEKAWIMPIPNSCWLLAAVNEVTRTVQVLISEEEKRPSTNHDLEEEPSKNHEIESISCGNK